MLAPKVTAMGASTGVILTKEAVARLKVREEGKLRGDREVLVRRGQRGAYRGIARPRLAAKGRAGREEEAAASRRKRVCAGGRRIA